MNKEIVEIKKRGKLIAFNHCWQYWLYEGYLYSINVEGTVLCIWCGANRLGQHLHRLYQVTGHTFFTEDEEMMAIDKEFLSQFTYA